MIGLVVGISFGQRNNPMSAALRDASRIFGGSNILSWGIFDDAAPGTLASVPLRIGGTGAPKSTARATVSTVLARQAAVFSANAAGMGYVLKTAVKTQIVVARWDGGATFPGYSGLLTSNEHPGLIGKSGASSFFEHGAIYRDGVATYAVDALPHYYLSTSASATTAEVLLGNATNNPALNWIGPVWHVCQLATTATAQQIADYGTALKRLYPFLP